MAQASPRQPLGSQLVALQQEGAPNFALLVNIAPGVALAVDVTDRPGRQLGIVYGDVGQLLQRAVTRDALVQLRTAGVEYDARQIRALTTADVVSIGDGVIVLELDHVESAVPTIEFEHHMVHDGYSYSVSDHDSSVDIASPKYWHIITPNTAKRCHVKIAVISDHAALVEFFENPTTTANGTALAAYNNDRNSINATTMSFYYDPTVTADGTRLVVEYIGTYNPKTRIGGSSRAETEFILKQNEQYLVKVTPENDNTKVTVQIEFYEV